MNSTTRTFRHEYLLAVLLLVVVLRPFLAASLLGVRLFDAMVLVTMVVGAMCTTGGRITLRLAIGFSSVASVCRIAWYATESQPVLIGFLLALGASYLTIATHMLRGLLTSEEKVTTSTICGSVAVYLMIGMAWAVVYVLLELVCPASFTMGTGAPIDDRGFDRFIGFSFVTLMTVGYGNVVPATPQADALTTLEALIGQFYMAIIVARLVSMQLRAPSRVPQGAASGGAEAVARPGETT